MHIANTNWQSPNITPLNMITESKSKLVTGDCKIASICLVSKWIFRNLLAVTKNAIMPDEQIHIPADDQFKNRISIIIKRDKGIARKVWIRMGISTQKKLINKTFYITSNLHHLWYPNHHIHQDLYPLLNRNLSHHLLHMMEYHGIRY